MEMVAEPDCDPTVEFARTVARPAEFEQSAVVVVPPWVTTEIRGRPFCEKKELGRSVENATPVPSGTLAPFNVTTAWITVQVPATGLALLVKSRIWSALAPVVPPPPPPGVGATGESEEQYQVAAPTSAKPTRL
jgi:hypothetical protein